MLKLAIIDLTSVSIAKKRKVMSRICFGVRLALGFAGVLSFSLCLLLAVVSCILMLVVLCTTHYYTNPHDAKSNAPNVSSLECDLKELE